MIHLQGELEKLKDSLTEMSYLAMSQFSKSVEALLEFDKELAQDVIRQEKRINALELKIDKDCETIFTLQNPVAKDMRFVFATLKINNNLERIGDYAENIGFIVMDLEKAIDKSLLDALELRRMLATSMSMINDVIAAYNSGNSEIARGVFIDDIILDDINNNATSIIADQCRKNPENIENYLSLLSVIRKMERAGDHITNVAEEIVFYLEATILKHQERKKGKYSDPEGAAGTQA